MVRATVAFLYTILKLKCRGIYSVAMNLVYYRTCVSFELLASKVMLSLQIPCLLLVKTVSGATIQ
jgi:hypothetical protein